jgi:hypothetical protein
MTIHEMAAPVWDAWELALGSVPVEVTYMHHEIGVYLEHPEGAIVLENHRYCPKDAVGEVQFIRGHAFRRGPA